MGLTAVVSPASRNGEDRALRAMMELAREGPIGLPGLEGHARYRPFPTPVTTGSPSFATREAANGWELIRDNHGTSFPGWKGMPLFQTAQAILASLLARATAALLRPRSFSMRRAQALR